MAFFSWRGNRSSSGPRDPGSSKGRGKTDRRSSWLPQRTGDVRTQLRELREDVRNARKELKERESEMWSDKKKHISLSEKLQEATLDLKKEFEQRRGELEDAEKLNFTMREDLAKTKYQRENQEEKIADLIDELKRIQTRDSSDLYRSIRSSSRHRTPGGEKESLVEDVTEKCRKLRALVLKRWEYRQAIRKQNDTISKCKKETQDIKKELESITEHESEIVRIANSVRHGIEASTAQNTVEGTMSNARNIRNEEIVDKLHESTDRLQEMLRQVPHEFEIFEKKHDGTAVNPKYRWLMTALLQKIGLLYIQFNHQVLLRLGCRVNYRDPITDLKHKRYKLMNQLDQLEETQKAKLVSAQEEIPRLEADIKRLTENRDNLTKKFEGFKQTKMQLEDGIVMQQAEIDKKSEVKAQYIKLVTKVEELRKRLDRNTEKMNRGGRVAISTLAFDAIRQQGMLGDEEDEPSESVDYRKTKLRNDDSVGSWGEEESSTGRHRTKGGPPRDMDDDKWGEEDDDAPVGRSAAPVGRRRDRKVRGSSPPRRRPTAGGGSYSDEEWGNSS